VNESTCQRLSSGESALLRDPVTQPQGPQLFVERVDRTQSAEDLTVIGSDIETVVLNRAIKWHAERRIFRNAAKTVVLK